MKNVYKDGEKVGRFNLQKATVICTNREKNDTRYTRLLKTSSGAYVFERCTMWEGENENYDLISKDQAIEFMMDLDFGEKEIKAIFPEYIEVETV